MRNVLFVARRDIKIFFKSPGAYIIIFFFVTASSLWLYEINNFLAANRADFRSYFAVFPYLLIFIIPALVMGSIAGERQSGTLEILFTLPVSVSEIVLGKYAALLFESSILLALTIPIPLSLVQLGSFDTGQITGEYIGLFFLSSAFVSVSFWVSSFSSTQVQAYILSVFIFFIVTVSGILFKFSSVLFYISPASHYAAFEKGILDTRDISYYIFITLFSLFFSKEHLLMERWT